MAQEIKLKKPIQVPGITIPVGLPPDVALDQNRQPIGVDVGRPTGGGIDVEIGKPTIEPHEEPGDHPGLYDLDPDAAMAAGGDESDPLLKLFQNTPSKGPLYDLSFLKAAPMSKPQTSSNLDPDAIRAALQVLLQRK